MTEQENITQFFEKFRKKIIENKLFDDEEQKYPFLLTPEHKHYEGYYAIIVGDDTEIRSSEDGESFIVIDYHNEDRNMEDLRDENVIDYYLGKESAYELDYEQTYHYLKGFKQVVNRFLTEIDE